MQVLQGFFFFLPQKAKKKTHSAEQSLKMFVKMSLGKALNPEQLHTSCSLATNKEFNRKRLEALETEVRRTPTLRQTLENPHSKVISAGMIMMK